MLRPVQQNLNPAFSGAYIIKGSQQAVSRFDNEVKMLKIVKKNTQIMTMPLTDFYNSNQPYAELLVCTGDNVNNLLSHFEKEKRLQSGKLKKFVDDFNKWSKSKQKKITENLQKAVIFAEKESQDTSAPGEIAMKKGNPDIFLDWYSDSVRKSNSLYKQISAYGRYRFPEKIRRLDAGQAFNALISDNFNLKEGFIRSQKAPKVETTFSNNKEFRFKDDILSEVVTYRQNSAGEKILKTLEKIIRNKNGTVTRKVFKLS